MDEVIESSPNSTKNCREKYEQKRFARSQKIRKIRTRNSIKEKSVNSGNNLSANGKDLSSLGCSVIPSDPGEQKFDSINVVPVEEKIEEVIFKAPEIKECPKTISCISSSSGQHPAGKVFPSNLFDTQDPDEDLFDDEDLDEPRLSQGLDHIHDGIKPLSEFRKDCDFYENGRFIQFDTKSTQGPNSQPEQIMEMLQPPAHLIDIRDEKYPNDEIKAQVKEAKSDEDSGTIELFSDSIYGGLGKKYDEPRKAEPKFSSWTVYAKEMRKKKVFEPPKDFQNLKGEEITTIDEDLLSQMPPVHINIEQNQIDIQLERLPSEIKEIVEEFEEQEEFERSPNCSPIHLTLIRPQNTYKKGFRMKNRRSFEELISDKVVIPIDLDDLNNIEEPADIAELQCSTTPSELDFSRDSHIFVELDGLTQSFKRTCEEASLEISLASPNKSLVKPLEFQDYCSLESSPKSACSTPRSQR